MIYCLNINYLDYIIHYFKLYVNNILTKYQLFFCFLTFWFKSSLNIVSKWLKYHCNTLEYYVLNNIIIIYQLYYFYNLLLLR
nr:MAG TPA: hypothetical protein [Caudoviricetes sp.]